MDCAAQSTTRNACADRIASAGVRAATAILQGGEMGKRQRRRIREAETPDHSGRQDLDPPGPYMVCEICNEPLATFSRISPDGEQEEVIRYVHSLEFIGASGETEATGKDYGHEAVPVEGSPVNAAGACDFCNGLNPKWVFVPRRPIVFYDPYEKEVNYSSPWSCCDGCLPAVKSRSLGRMIDRAMASSRSMIHGLAPDERRIFRAGIRTLYAEYLKSAPAGPYELRPRPPHRPVGRRGSLRGV